MSRFYQTLTPNGEVELHAQGQFIYLAAASANVEIQVNDRPGVQLAQYDQIRTAEITRLIVRNLSNQPNQIALEVGYGQFVPANDGHQVTIGNWPALMKVEQTAPVEVSNWPQSMAIGNWPDSYRVTINNWKSVQAVKQSGDWETKISNFPAVQTVNVNNLPDVQKVEISNQPKRPDAMNSDVITIASGAGSIAANDKRIKLIIKADASNGEAVSIGSYPLDKGEVIKLSNTGAIALTGTDGDKVYFIEDVRA